MRAARPLVALLAVVLLAACSGGGASPSSAASGAVTVTATLKEFSIQLSQTELSAGHVNFIVDNRGSMLHEFVILKTDLAEDALPVEGGEVIEDDLDVVDEVENLRPSSSGTLDVELQPGHYVVICNINGHYGQGMHAAFTVS